MQTGISCSSRTANALERGNSSAANTRYDTITDRGMLLSSPDGVGTEVGRVSATINGRHTTVGTAASSFGRASTT